MNQRRVRRRLFHGVHYDYLLVKNGLHIIFTGLHHVDPHVVRPSVLVKECCNLRSTHVTSRFGSEMLQVRQGDFSGDFLSPALL